MTAPVFAAHPGCHCAPPGRVALFFRRALRPLRRKPAAPERTALLSGAAEDGGSLYDDKHPVTEPGGFPALGDRMVAEVRAEYEGLPCAQAAALSVRQAREHADALLDGYASQVDRLRREAGLPSLDEMRAAYFGCPWPPVERPVWAEPEPRGPVHDTRLDISAPHYAPDVTGGLSFDCGNGLHAPVCDGRNCSCSCHGKAAPAYGQAPVARVLEAERLAEVMLP